MAFLLLSLVATILFSTNALLFILISFHFKKILRTVKLRVNKYGLKDTISSLVKREVRQRCGFGCVNCGNAVYQYEHLDPTFAEAKELNRPGIVGDLTF